VSKESEAILIQWYNSNKDDPYPSTLKKKSLATETGLSARQVSIWFSKRRKNRINHIVCRLSLTQKQKLRKCYGSEKNPRKEQIKSLSKELELPGKTISTWYSAERHQEKKNLLNHYQRLN
jgi:hypothetical protein